MGVDLEYKYSLEEISLVSEEFVVTIYNDENHSFDQVIMVVSGALDCSREEARRIANIIDKLGRTVVFKGHYAECQSIAKQINSIGLFVRIFPLNVYVSEEVSQLALKFLMKICKVKTLKKFQRHWV